MSGTPERVRDLITQAGLSQHEFAARIGLDDSKLSKTLSGVRRFSSLDLARIAEAFEVTVDYLITGEEPALVLAARTTGGSAQAAVAAATRYSSIRTDLASVGYLLPWQRMAPAPDSGRFVEQGERLAQFALDRVERAGHSSAARDLPAVIEAVFAVDVAVAELGSGFDGLAVSSDAVKLIVLATSPVPARQRFTLAHELSHLLCGDDQGLHLDQDVFDREQQKTPSEVRANAFAAAFLMPESVLRGAISPTDLNEAAFARLACELTVSPSTLAFQLRKLRIIDSGLCDQFAALSGARAASIAGCGEQWAQLVAAARGTRRPALLVRDAYAAYESGATTLRPYANLLDVDVDELRTALEADTGAFGAS